MQMRDHLSLLASVSSRCGRCARASSPFCSTPPRMKDCFCHNLHTFLPLRPRAAREKKWNSLALSHIFLICFYPGFSRTMHFMCHSLERYRGWSLYNIQLWISQEVARSSLERRREQSYAREYNNLISLHFSSVIYDLTPGLFSTFTPLVYQLKASFSISSIEEVLKEKAGIFF